MKMRGRRLVLDLLQDSSESLQIIRAIQAELYNGQRSLWTLTSHQLLERERGRGMEYVVAVIIFTQAL